MRSGLARSLAVCTSTAALGCVWVTPASAARSYQCDGAVQRVLQRATQPTVLQAATKISVRGYRCKKAISTVGAMLLQVGASSPSYQSGNPRYWFADDADFWRKTGWTIRHTSGDPRGKTGARWHVTKGKVSLRFTRWM